MNYRTSWKLMWTGMLLGLFLMCMAQAMGNNVPGIIGVILFAVVLLQAFVFYRCPHCGKSLMEIRGEIPKHCIECGSPLK